MYRVPAVGVGGAVAVTGFYAGRLALLAAVIVVMGVLLVALAHVRERTVFAGAEPREREHSAECPCGAH